MSTPQASGNRFAALASTDGDDVIGDRQFTLPRSQRRAIAKRQREKSEGTAPTDRQSSQPSQQQQQHQQETKRRFVTGKASGLSSSIHAAKKIEKKAVFCIDNIGLQYDENDIRSHVTSLGVKVFTCYEAKPRRRPDETPDDVADRKAFRLCVNVDDRDQLLNPRVWPDSVQISDWFFRGNSNQLNNKDKRQRVQSPEQRDFVASSLVATGRGGDSASQTQCDGATATDHVDLPNDQPDITATSPPTTTSANVDVMDIAVDIAVDGVSNVNQVDIGDETIIYHHSQRQ